jgi:hypothetical protein
MLLCLVLVPSSTPQPGSFERLFAGMRHPAHPSRVYLRNDRISAASAEIVLPVRDEAVRSGASRPRTYPEKNPDVSHTKNRPSPPGSFTMLTSCQLCFAFSLMASCRATFNEPPLSEQADVLGVVALGRRAVVNRPLMLCHTHLQSSGSFVSNLDVKDV